MCRASDALRAVLGIRAYRPGDHPHARVRKPTWHGSRGNGHARGGLSVPVDPVIAELSRQHRLIRQTIDDLCRVRGRE